MVTKLAEKERAIHSLRKRIAEQNAQIAGLKADNTTLSKECGKFSDRNIVVLRARIAKQNAELKALKAAGVHVKWVWDCDSGFTRDEWICRVNEAVLKLATLL